MTYVVKFRSFHQITLDIECYEVHPFPYVRPHLMAVRMVWLDLGTVRLR